MTPTIVLIFKFEEILISEEFTNEKKYRLKKKLEKVYIIQYTPPINVPQTFSFFHKNEKKIRLPYSTPTELQIWTF